MKKEYKKPTITVTLIENTDVITLSGLTGTQSQSSITSTLTLP